MLSTGPQRVLDRLSTGPRRVLDGSSTGSWQVPSTGVLEKCSAAGNADETVQNLVI